MNYEEINEMLETLDIGDKAPRKTTSCELAYNNLQKIHHKTQCKNNRSYENQQHTKPIN